MVVGLNTGRWIVFEAATQQTVSSHTDGNEQIECLSFSPDGAYLAVGSRDNIIYVYSITEEGRKYTRVGRCIVSKNRLILFESDQTITYKPVSVILRVILVSLPMSIGQLIVNTYRRIQEIMKSYFVSFRNPFQN